MLIKKERIPILHILLIGLFPSFLKKIIYRFKGYSLERGTKLSFGCVVIGKNVEIGEDSSIGFFTIIRAKEIKIGRYVKIGSMTVIDTEKFHIDDDSRINEQVYVGGINTPESKLIMGKRTIIMQMSCLNPTLPIVIGDDSGIGGHCLLFTHGSWNSQLEGYPVTFAPITLGKKVWLPWRVFIMPGVTIGDNVVIGANSLVSIDIPSNSLAAGSPAKILKENYPTALSEESKREVIQKIFEDFVSYLKYHDFKTERKNTGFDFQITISRKRLSGIIIYRDHLTDDLTVPASSNQILFFNKCDEKTIFNRYKDGFEMVVGLENNKRLGTSLIGEEVIKFFSRYGIRFDRLY